jgi:hypothetical protein
MITNNNSFLFSCFSLRSCMRLGMKSLRCATNLLKTVPTQIGLKYMQHERVQCTNYFQARDFASAHQNWVCKKSKSAYYSRALICPLSFSLSWAPQIFFALPKPSGHNLLLPHSQSSQQQQTPPWGPSTACALIIKSPAQEKGDCCVTHQARFLAVARPDVHLFPALALWQWESAINSICTAPAHTLLIVSSTPLESCLQNISPLIITGAQKEIWRDMKYVLIK